MLVFLAFMLVFLAASSDGAPGDCTFESGLCGYVQDNNDDFNWTIRTGPTKTNYTGPSQDHTTGSGKYIFLNTTYPWIQNNYKAIITSPVLTNSKDNCVKFFYHMKGYNIKALNVYTQDSTGSKELRWSLSGDQESTVWSNATFPLPGPNLTLVFEGVSGTGKMANIAVDDIKNVKTPFCPITPCEAHPSKTVKPPTHITLPRIPRCGKRHSRARNTRIIGGRTAAQGAWPWQVIILKKKGNTWETFACAGSLITPEWVVSTATCFNHVRKEEYKNYRVRTGAHYRNKTTGVEQDLDIERIFIHPDFNSKPIWFDNDIVLIKLKTPAILDKYTNVACLQDNKVQFDGTSNCHITGWGKTSSRGNFSYELMEGKVTLMEEKKCSKMYKDNQKPPSVEYYKINQNVQCLGDVPGTNVTTTCQGDTSGPLVCEKSGKWYLVGAASYGPRYCIGLPAVYTKVNVHSQWLAETIANN